MNRRNPLTGLMGLLAAWSWKPEQAPSYKVMKLSPAAAQLADLSRIKKAVEEAARTIIEAQLAHIKKTVG